MHSAALLLHSLWELRLHYGFASGAKADQDDTGFQIPVNIPFVGPCVLKS